MVTVMVTVMVYLSWQCPSEEEVTGQTQPSFTASPSKDTDKYTVTVTVTVTVTPSLRTVPFCRGEFEPESVKSHFT